MKFITKERSLSRRPWWRAAAAAGLCCGLVGMPSLPAQDIAGDAADSIEDRLSPGNLRDAFNGDEVGSESGPSDPIEQRFQDRVEDALNGRPADSSSRALPGAAAQNAPRATVDQGLGQPYYRDADGRFFSVDPRGRRTYIQDQRPRLRATQTDRVDRSQSADQGPRLGVMISESPEGIRIQNVQPSSVAAAAGFQAGDVLRTMNGELIQNPVQLQRMVRSMSAGQSVPVTVMRNGEEQSLTANFTGGEGSDYQASKPALSDSDASDAGLQQDIQELRDELDSLRQQVKQLQGEQSPEAGSQRDASADSPQSSDNPAVRAQSSEKVDLSVADEQASAASDTEADLSASSVAEEVQDASEAIEQ